MQKQMLSDRVVNEILEMITVEERFRPGDKLPNENELSEELGVSRTTLREAIRALTAKNILEIRRGKGTYVSNNPQLTDDFGLGTLNDLLPRAKDIFEMRLLLEPQTVYLAVLRATDGELEKILKYGRAAEVKILQGEDYTTEEQLFHNMIARATHNEFVMRAMPIINKGVWSGIRGEKPNEELKAQSLAVRRMLLDFIASRNSDGAQSCMRLHILLGMMKIGIQPPGDTP